MLRALRGSLCVFLCVSIRTKYKPADGAHALSGKGDIAREILHFRLCWRCLSCHHPLVSALPEWQLMWICQIDTLQYKDITTSLFHALVLCWWCGNTQAICKLVEQSHCVHYILVDASRHLCRWKVCHVYTEQLACWDLIRSILLDVQHESKVFQFYLFKAPASPSCELFLCQGNPQYWSA